MQSGGCGFRWCWKINLPSVSKRHVKWCWQILLSGCTPFIKLFCTHRCSLSYDALKEEFIAKVLKWVSWESRLRFWQGGQCWEWYILKTETKLHFKMENRQFPNDKWKIEGWCNKEEIFRGMAVKFKVKSVKNARKLWGVHHPSAEMPG